MNPILDPSSVVLEVKYNGFLLSYIKDMATSVDSSKLSISKYSLARQQGIVLDSKFLGDKTDYVYLGQKSKVDRGSKS